MVDGSDQPQCMAVNRFGQCEMTVANSVAALGDESAETTTDAMPFRVVADRRWELRTRASRPAVAEWEAYTR